MKRPAYQKLVNWSRQKGRKPLILSGVRQVGKTYLLRQFGENEFPQVHYFNFEKRPELASVFEPNLDPKRIINELSFHLNKPIHLNQDLVIFDEIQAIPKAITSLKYFQEDLSELAVACAGSLLGLELTPTSYPVGKTETIHLYPMTFLEFLQNMNEEQSVEFIKNCKKTTKIPPLIHQHLWEMLKRYFIVGGLPEVVTTFQQHSADLFTAFASVRDKQEQLLMAYYADIAKHSGKVNAMHINRVWQAVPAQMASYQNSMAGKFKFRGVVPGVDRYSRLAGAIDWLITAGLVIKIPVVNYGQSPLFAYTKEGQFKLLLFDIGILGAMIHLSPQSILNYDYGAYKGYFAENYVAQELSASLEQPLFSWQENQSEVEFLCEIADQVIPIEVKSGWITRNKSLQKFVNKYHPPYSVIMSANSLMIDDTQNVHCYPLYLAAHDFDK